MANAAPKKNRIQSGATVLLLPMACMLLELLLRATAALPFSWENMALLLLPVALGCLLSLPALLPRRPGARTALLISFAEVLTVLYLVAFFLDNSFKTFMEPAAVFGTAGDVMGDYSSVLGTIITKGLPVILLYHVPVLLMGLTLLFLAPPRLTLPSTLALTLSVALLFGGGVGLLLRSPQAKAQWRQDYRFDPAVRRFGLGPALMLDAWYGIFPLPQPGFVPQTPLPPPPVNPPPVMPPAPDDPLPPPPPVEYGYNALDIDFAALASSAPQNVAQLHNYVASQSPSRQNAYTGLFQGKNLIFITAEAFSAEVIDPVRTPTLYRMATRGIRFQEYYQPSWGGSTSTGEYSLLTGLIPLTAGVMQRTEKKDMSQTIGNLLMDAGYFSRAYHNNSYTYYDRHLTHENLGYEKFIGMGNGMEAGVQNYWPQSDREMMEFTISQYIDHQPFSVYYMTVSGHSVYTNLGNSMSFFNRHRVADMEASDFIKAYHAANLELEDALTVLVAELEKAGIADDTVIVLSTDHYPYGLEKSAAWLTDRDYLEELYGYKADTNPKRDHSALIIWSGCLEDWDPITVTTPVYSLDVLPTLCNLFGLCYDSRLYVGRDVFSDQMPLVVWNDKDWLTDLGYYESSSAVFTPREGVTVPEGYVRAVCAVVQNKLTYSRSALDTDYFRYVFSP